MQVFAQLFQSLEVPASALKNIKINLGENTIDTPIGALAVVLFKMLTGSYGIPDIESLEIVRESKDALELAISILDSEDEDVKVSPVPIIISDRQYVCLPRKQNDTIKTVVINLADMEDVPMDKISEVISMPMTSDAIDLSSIVCRVIIPHLESVALSTQSQEPEPAE